MNRDSMYPVLLLCSLAVLFSCETSNKESIGEANKAMVDNVHSSNSYGRVLTEISTAPFLLVKAIQDMDTGITSIYVGENGGFFYVFGRGRSLEEYITFMSESDTLRLAMSELILNKSVSDLIAMLEYGRVEYDAYIDELASDGLESLIDRCFPGNVLDREKCLKTEKSYNYLVFLLLTNDYMVQLGDINGGTHLVGKLDEPREYPYKIDR